MTRAGMILFGVCLVLLGAMATLPARWLSAALPDDIPVRLVGAQGTLWSGQAMLATGKAPFSRTLPGRLTWHLGFDPFPVLTLHQSGLSGPVMVRPVAFGIEFSGQSLTLPATVLGTLDPRLAALAPLGELQFSWPVTRLTPGGPAPGTPLLQVHWMNAASGRLSTGVLGSFLVTASAGRQGGADMLLTTRQGPLFIEGSGQWSPSVPFSVNASVRIDTALDAGRRTTLQELLAEAGVRPDGRISRRS